MAKMRRVSVQGSLPWLPEGNYPVNGKTRWHAGWLANIENGDTVQVMPMYDHNGPTGFHEYNIYSGVMDEDTGEFTNMGRAEGFTSPEEAMRAAEKHYYSLDHSNRKPADSSVDYSDLNNFRGRDEISDDYGDIFGSGR